MLPLDQRGHGKKCKLCKAADTRRRNAVKAQEEKDALKSRFDSADAWQQFNESGTHRYLVPKQEEFTTENAFQEAWAIHEQRLLNGGEGRKSKREYMDKDNENRRAKYVRKTNDAPTASQVCKHCKRQQPYLSFRPSQKHSKKLAAFDAAMKAIDDVNASRETHPELFEAWDTGRTSMCTLCKDIERTRSDSKTPA